LKLSIPYLFQKYLDKIQLDNFLGQKKAPSTKVERALKNFIWIISI